MRISDDEITANIKLVLNSVTPGIVSATNAMLDLQDARAEIAQLKEKGIEDRALIKDMPDDMAASTEEYHKLLDAYIKLAKDNAELIKCIEDLRGGV